MTNPVWEWLIRSGLSAYDANESMQAPPAAESGPGWSFDRFGQSKTELPDGRTILIAGEHEDSYDPNFYIYNDVIIHHRTGEVEIYAYPEGVFPPTDFHTSTLFDDHILVLGSLGYQDRRIPGKTQVLRLELETWKVSAIETRGQLPGWIFGHDAKLLEGQNELIISGGELERGGEHSLIENIDDWCLDLTTWHWSRLTCKPWMRFEICRKDGGYNHLWEMRNLVFSNQIRDSDVQERSDELSARLGSPPDLEILERLYEPPVADEYLGQDDEDHTTYRVRIEGVTVRYVEGWSEIALTIEGVLSEAVREALKRDLEEKLAALEQAPIECLEIAPQ